MLIVNLYYNFGVLYNLLQTYIIRLCTCVAMILNPSICYRQSVTQFRSSLYTQNVSLNFSGGPLPPQQTRQSYYEQQQQQPAPSQYHAGARYDPRMQEGSYPNHQYNVCCV